MILVSKKNMCSKHITLYCCLVPYIYNIFASCLVSALSSDLFSSEARDIGTLDDDNDLSFIDNLDTSYNLFTSNTLISSITSDEDNEYNFLDQPIEDSSLNDPFLLTDTSPVNCLSLSVNVRKIRIRSESCPNEQPQQSSQEQNNNILPSTDADSAAMDRVRKLWCSFTNTEGFGNIPVCSVPDEEGFSSGPENSEEQARRLDDPQQNPTNSDASPFRNIMSGHLSEFNFLSLFPCKSQVRTPSHETSG